ncbi:PucR family transcriptional regulator [Aeromicrobium fastidiosum]|uniref:PucR family transcriptional regulator n=1 Tax=Aeromicrobium fastidiosum TaxID=52699 RepID=A0A641AQE4_9ACTN|nr:helix-turn-helix domain-containing protein [Aeromicrobium fastidiosum]KAA1378475.1 hypothetical protein ESP62_008970 [Aeromicrobium fastidiosum]MBP2392560.1 hypothetical protein [Aeromicrobium fastidiosum]
MSSRDDLSVDELIGRCGLADLTVACGDVTRVVRSAMCTIHDPLVPMDAGGAGVLLAVGVAAADLPELVRSAEAAGFDAVVARGAAETAEQLPETGLGVLDLGATLTWSQVERLVSGILTMESNRHGGDLFDTANTTASLLGGAVTIENLDQTVLAYSTVDGQVIDEDRRRSILGRHVPTLPENDEQYAAVFASSGVVRITGVGHALDRLAIAVRLGTDVLGSMWVVDEGGLLPRDADYLLERAADLVAVQIVQNRSVSTFEREQRASLVQAVLEGRRTARPAVSRLGMPARGPFVVAALAVDFVASAGGGADVETHPRWNRLVTMVNVFVSAWQPTAGVCVLGGTIYILVPGVVATDVERVAANAAILVERAAATGIVVRAGVGSVVMSVDEISSSRREAELLATILGTEDDPSVLTALSCQSRVALWSLAQVLAEQPVVASEPISRLEAHDEQRGTDFVHTVATWFRHRMDTKRTAEALSVHPNTLRYRLGRARDISGLRDEADDLLLAWLTLRSRYDPAGSPRT